MNQNLQTRNSTPPTLDETLDAVFAHLGAQSFMASDSSRTQRVERMQLRLDEWLEGPTFAVEVKVPPAQSEFNTEANDQAELIACQSDHRVGRVARFRSKHRKCSPHG